MDADINSDESNDLARETMVLVDNLNLVRPCFLASAASAVHKSY